MSYRVGSSVHDITLYSLELGSIVVKQNRVAFVRLDVLRCVGGVQFSLVRIRIERPTGSVR